MSVPSLGTNSRPSFSSPFGLQGQPSRAHLPSLRAGHCTGLKGAPGPGSLERLPCPGPQISPSRASSHYLASPIPLLLPPFVGGGNPQSTHLGFLDGNWSADYPEGPEAPVFPSPESTKRWETACSPPTLGPISMAAQAAPGAARWPRLQPLEHTCLQ